MPTNFLEAAGTNGFIGTPFNLMSSELNSLANGANAVSAGTFSQTNFASAIWGMINFKSGGAFTPLVGGYLAGWFLYSPDSGTTYEKVVAATDLPRAPDFIIPMFASAYATNDISQASGLVRLPWPITKVYIANRLGTSVTLPASNNLITCGPVAVQY